MTPLPLESLEFVGLDGGIIGPCGQAAVIARHKYSNRFFKLFPRDEYALPNLTLSNEEMLETASTGRIVLFPSPLPAIPNAVALYITARFLKAMHLQRPFTSKLVERPWLSVQPESQHAQATCATVFEASTQFARWAEAIRRRSLHLLEHYYRTSAAAALKRALQILEMGLFAAHLPDSQFQLYLLLAVASLETRDHNKVINIFEMMIKPHFPDWTWDMFQQEVGQHRDLIKLTGGTKSHVRRRKLAAISSQNQKTSKERKTRGPAATVHKLVRELIQRANSKTLVQGCIQAAMLVRQRFPVSEIERKQVAEKLTFDFSVLLNDDVQLSAVGAEPSLFYYYFNHPDFVVREPLPLFTADFLECAEDARRKGIEWGPLLRTLSTFRPTFVSTDRHS